MWGNHGTMTTEPEDRYLTMMGLGPERVSHWEHWSCPDAETHITGIDYYEHPRQCRLRLVEMYPQLERSLGIPADDTPKPRPTLGLGEASSNPQRHTVRWGDGESGTWLHGEAHFEDAEAVFAFSPLESADFSDMPVVERRDYTDEEKLYEAYRARYPAEWGDRPPEGKAVSVGFYNTMFMWPLLTFGWELFLQTCLDARFERLMYEFAEINRRVFRVFARLPVRFVVCHDDIVTSRGPVCSPQWMRKYVFPRYEEFWSMVRSAGKEVIFMADGCMDAYADDVIACGARGIVTEPYTDFKALARRHENVTLAGEGDNRILMRNDADEIEAMVRGMVQTARMTGGYFMCIGNHIPWNTPPEAVKRYLDLSTQLAVR